ncbi:hypothetical protein HPY42_05275 [Coprothermobacteraceae bacterium]|nr:hypothetical protein [Coprothermobacteraceae bacterium]
MISLEINEEVLKRFYYEPFDFQGRRIYRRVLIMEKSGWLGKVAAYKLLDFIVPNMTFEELWPLIKPIKDVMMQRFLVIGTGKMKTKHFALGLMGWAHVGFLEGNEKILEDMRKEFREALKPQNEALEV